MRFSLVDMNIDAVDLHAVFGADQLVIPAMVLVLAVLLIGRKKL